MKQYLTLVAGTLLALVACSKETGPSGQAGERPISFDVAATGVQTRAQNQIATDAALQGESIGVFAAYTGKLTYENTTVTPDYMYNQEVTYNTSAKVWEYTPVKYWPNSESDYVSFFAYAPYEANPAEGRPTGIIGMSRKVDLGDPWINFRLPATIAEQVDLLYGQQRIVEGGAVQYTSWLDQQKYNWGDAPLKFTFKHALACIGEPITIQMSDLLYAQMHEAVDITIDKVTVTYRNLTTKGRLVLRAAGDPNWKEIISGELLTSRTYDSGAFPEIKKFSKGAASNPGPMTLVASGSGLFYIPLQIAGQPKPEMEITVYYTVTSAAGTALEASFQDTATTTLQFNVADAGTKKGLALTLGHGTNLEAEIVTPPEGVTMPDPIVPTPNF